MTNKGGGVGGSKKIVKGAKLILKSGLKINAKSAMVCKWESDDRSIFFYSTSDGRLRFGVSFADTMERDVILRGLVYE